MCFYDPSLFRVPDDIIDMTSSLKMVEKIDCYIGRLYSDIGMVPEKFEYFSEYREVTGTHRGVVGP